MNWNVSYSAPPTSTNSLANFATGFAVEAVKIIPSTPLCLLQSARKIANYNISQTRSQVVPPPSLESTGKAYNDLLLNYAFQVGGGPTKTISHPDGTQTIITYSGPGVDAEAIIIKVEKDGSWRYDD